MDRKVSGIRHHIDVFNQYLQDLTKLIIYWSVSCETLHLDPRNSTFCRTRTEFPFSTNVWLFLTHFNTSSVFISELTLLLQNPFLPDFERVGDDINKRHLWSALHLKNGTECLRRIGTALLIGYSLGYVVALLRIHLWLFQSPYFSVKTLSWFWNKWGMMVVLNLFAILK